MSEETVVEQMPPSETVGILFVNGRHNQIDLSVLANRSIVIGKEVNYDPEWSEVRRACLVIAEVEYSDNQWIGKAVYGGPKAETFRSVIKRAINPRIEVEPYRDIAGFLCFRLRRVLNGD